MEARVQALRGTLSIIRDQAGGTEVVAQIPVQPQTESGKPAQSADGPLDGTT
ncbi:hypothetical protein D3C87_2170610 [compost metagenome]